MNGTSGFQEVRPSTSRPPADRFRYEQRHQCGTSPDNSQQRRHRGSRSSSRQRRRSQMKRSRSLIPSIILGLAMLSLLVFGNPVSGFAQTPHTCPNGVHQGTSLGGVTSLNFVFAKDCPPYTSSTISWKWSILRYSDNVQLCSGGPTNVPPTPIPVNCGGLPLGSYPKVKVVIYYQTTQGGSWMSHTELYGN